MKNTIKNYTLIICSFITFSCQNDLDLFPKDGLSSNSYWQDEEQFKLAGNLFYNYLPNFTTKDSWSENVYQGGDSADTPISAGTNLTPAEDRFWNSIYVRMRSYNLLIEQGEGKDFAKKYVAEARYFRAFDYYNMLTRYGGVPLITKVLDINSPEIKQPRASREEMTSFILSELDAAAIDLPKQSELENTDIGRITWGAAMALKSRVALFGGTWAKYHGTGENANALLDKAIDAANKIITSNEYSLFVSSSNPDESYRLLFVSDEAKDCPEQILARRYSDAQNIVHNFRGVGGAGVSATKSFVDSYLCTDGLPIDISPLFGGRTMMNSEYKNRDPRMKQSIIEPGTFVFNGAHSIADSDGNPANAVYPRFNALNTGYFFYKFVDQKLEKLGFGKPDWYIQIIRYGEILLNYAEAIYEKNGSISDEDLDKSINKLRDRVDMIHLTNAHVSGNGLNMRDEIRRERSVELFYEGFRWDDIRRWKIAETVLPVAKIGALYAGTEFETYYADDKTKKIKLDANGFILLSPESDRFFEVNKHYLLPIPSNEIKLMEIEQNPNWGL